MNNSINVYVLDVRAYYVDLINDFILNIQENRLTMILIFEDLCREYCANYVNNEESFGDAILLDL